MTSCSSQCASLRPADPSSPPLPASEIDALLERLVAEWHVVDPGHAATGFEGRICDLHKFNFQLWHEEDIARSPEVTDARIAAVKRNIDRFNQARNDAIEKVDDWLVTELAAHGIQAAAGTPAATETPGSAIDRLSILEPADSTCASSSTVPMPPRSTARRRRPGWRCSTPSGAISSRRSTVSSPRFSWGSGHCVSSG